jgi:hypothetical protein
LFSLGSLFENDKRSPDIWATFVQGEGSLLISTKNVLGDFLQTHLVTLFEI